MSKQSKRHMGLEVQGDLVTSNSLMFRNKIINGNFDIWQRSTSQTSDGYGSDDRWNNLNNSSTKTHSQQAFALGQTAVPGNPKYFSQTVVSSVASVGSYTIKQQRIESVTTLAGQTATLSFWAKADAPRNIAVEFEQVFGNGGSPSAPVEAIGVTTIALTTSWKKYTVTVDIPSVEGKTLGTNNDDRLQLNMWFDAGSLFNNRTNSLGNQSGTFDIAQVQLEAGSSASAFEHRPIGTELALCQRYFQIHYIEDRAIGISPSNVYRTFLLPVQMRASGVITWADARGTTNAGDSGVTLGRSLKWRSVPVAGASGWTYWSSASASINAEL